MPLVLLKKLKKSYGDRLLFDIEKLQIEDSDRIGLVGTNGSGKTTLFRLIKGLEEPDEGIIERQTTVELLPQLKDAIGTKSGGEVTADYIVQALNKRPKLLLADEPTTHLDISHIDWVEKSFKQFNGAFLLVSHDRTFLDQVCTTIWELDGKTVTVYPGNYTAYKREKENQRQHQQTEYEKYTNKLSQLTQAKERKARQAVNATKRKAKVGDSEYNLKGSAPYFQKNRRNFSKYKRQWTAGLRSWKKSTSLRSRRALLLNCPTWKN